MKLSPDFISEFVSISDTAVVKASSINCVWLEGDVLKLTLENVADEEFVVNDNHAAKLLYMLELNLINK